MKRSTDYYRRRAAKSIASQAQRAARDKVWAATRRRGVVAYYKRAVDLLTRWFT